MSEEIVKSVWLSGSSLLKKGKNLAPEVAAVLAQLGVSASVADVKEAMVNLKGPEETISGLSDIAKAQVSMNFWLVGRHLLNGGHNPNSNVKAILLKLGIKNFSVINNGIQTPMLQLKVGDSAMIKGISLIAKSKFVC